MAKTERIQNMTKGSPAKLIFTFAIPLMLGNVFQQFYTVVDTAIVGQALGVNALAALGAADWLNWLVLGLIQGLDVYKRQGLLCGRRHDPRVLHDNSLLQRNAADGF